jgi:GntR family transcriptional regulator
MVRLIAIIENEIMDELLNAINEKEYKADDRLPSDNELADKYTVPRMKIREIYNKLEQMGYIYSLQGRGRFVKRRNENIQLVLSGNISFSEKMREQGYDLQTMNIFCERIPYNQRIYDEIKAEREDEVYKIGRLRVVNGEPIALHISYVSNRLFPNIAEEGNEITSMFQYFKEKGFTKYSSGKSILEIEYPTSWERSCLNCGELVPVLKLESNCRDDEKKVILEYTEILYRGDRFKYEIQNRNEQL